MFLQSNSGPIQSPFFSGDRGHLCKNPEASFVRRTEKNIRQPIEVCQVESLASKFWKSFNEFASERKDYLFCKWSSRT